MSVRAIRFRGIMAKHCTRIVFSHGESDNFSDSFSSLSPVLKRRYDELGETIESSQVAIDWYGKQGPSEKTECRDCNTECLASFKFCPQCGHEL